jgi:hypothetical protein
MSVTPLTALDVVFLLTVTSTSMVGAYLTWRRPENPIGLSLAGFGMTFTLGASSDPVALSESPVAEWAAWLGTWQWAAGMVLLLVLLPLLFPEGRLPSPRFRWVIPVALLGLGMLIAGNAFRATTSLESGDGDVVLDLPLPLPVPTSVFDALATLGLVLVLVAMMGAIVGVVRRFRRSTGLERQQMKVFGTGLVVALSMVIVNLFLFELGHDEVANFLFTGAVAVLITSISVAVLRYRLYDLGRVISRSITYSIVAVLVAIVYGLGAVWLPTLLLGEQSPIFVAGSTLFVAAMFNPTRRRVMSWVDRRFNRSRYDAERVVDQFSLSLRDQSPDTEIVDGWVGVVSKTMQPTSVGVWVRD